MPAQLRISLTEEQAQALRELRQAHKVPQRVRDRAHIVLLNAQGKKTSEIANIFECHAHTVRNAVQRWVYRGISGLWEEKGRGSKPKLKAADLEYIEQCLKEERTYNSSQLVRKLKQERLIELSGDSLRRILKKKTTDGKEHGIVIEKNKTRASEKQNKQT
jgi:transposase